MLITPSFTKSLIVEQFQGDYLNSQVSITHVLFFPGVSHLTTLPVETVSSHTQQPTCYPRDYFKKLTITISLKVSCSGSVDFSSKYFSSDSCSRSFKPLL